MNKRRLERIVQKQQEESFVQNWSVRSNKKEYNALEDPHATFYFCNKSVNRHLKGLSKAFNKEQHGKEKDRMKQLIKNKINETKLPSMKMSPSLLKQYQQTNDSQRSFQGHSRKKSDGYFIEKKMKNEVSFSIKDFSRYQRPYQVFKIKKTQNNLAKRLKSQSDAQKAKNEESKDLNEEEIIGKSHETERKLFLDFLAKKRLGLSASQEIQQQLCDN